MHPGYIALLEYVWSHPTMLIHYQEDLIIHDFNALHLHNPERFYWGVRSSGTDLFFRKEDVKWAQTCKKHRTNEVYLFWNGFSLVEVGIDEVITALSLRTYVFDILENEKHKEYQEITTFSLEEAERILEETYFYSPGETYELYEVKHAEI